MQHRVDSGRGARCVARNRGRSHHVLSSHDYVLGLPLLVLGLGILTLWYVKHFRD